jgi:tRNA(fMet)-specific endonuclease VapC
LIYVLDTDHMSLLDRGSAEGGRIRQRIDSLPPDDIATTIISYEEQMRGWLARVSQARTLERAIVAYRGLKRQLQTYRDMSVMDFDERAVERFQGLWVTRIRVGTMDLKIAAIALANDATVITPNLADFGKVPGLRVEDWST